MEWLKTSDLKKEQKQKSARTTSLFGLDRAAPGRSKWNGKRMRGERRNFNDPSWEIGPLQKHRGEYR